MCSKVGGKKHNVSKCVCASTFLHICVQIYGFLFVCMCMFACMMCAYWHKSTSALCGIVNASKQSLSVLPLHAGGLRVVLWRTAQRGSMKNWKLLQERSLKLTCFWKHIHKENPVKKTTPVVRLLAAFLRVADLPLEQAAIAVAVAPSQNPINALSWSTSTSSLRFQTMSVAVRVVDSTYTDSSEWRCSLHVSRICIMQCREKTLGLRSLTCTAIDGVLLQKSIDYHTWIVIDCPTQGSASLAIRNYLEFNLGQSQLTHSPTMWNKWRGSDCERLSWFFCVLYIFIYFWYIGFCIDRWTNHASSSYWELNDIQWISIIIFQDDKIQVSVSRHVNSSKDCDLNRSAGRGLPPWWTPNSATSKARLRAAASCIAWAARARAS